MCLCGRFRNVFQIQPNCIWNPPCFIYSSSFPSVWPCFISLSSLFCQWIHFLFYLLFLVCVFVCLCVWPWLTGHCCSALQPIPLGPCLCCLFSDLDSLSLSLWVALLPLSPPPSFSLASLMLFFLFFCSFPSFPFPFSSDLLSVHALVLVFPLRSMFSNLDSLFPSLQLKSTLTRSLSPRLSLLFFISSLHSLFSLPSASLLRFSPYSQPVIYVSVLCCYTARTQCKVQWDVSVLSKC